MFLWLTNYEYIFAFGFGSLLASISIIFCTRASTTDRFVRNATDPSDNRIYTLPVVSPLESSACATRNVVMVSGFLPAALLFMLLAKEAASKNRLILISKKLQDPSQAQASFVSLDNLPFIGLDQFWLRPRRLDGVSGVDAID
jgi:hypothetical protein